MRVQRAKEPATGGALGGEGRTWEEGPDSISLYATLIADQRNRMFLRATGTRERAGRGALEKCTFLRVFNFKGALLARCTYPEEQQGLGVDVEVGEGCFGVVQVEVSAVQRQVLVNRRHLELFKNLKHKRLVTTLLKYSEIGMFMFLP